MTATAAKTAAAPAQAQRPWWLTLILGVAAIVVGALLLWGNLVTQVRTYFLLVEVLGIWWLVDGIFDIVHMFTDHRQWAWKLFIGIVSIIAGGYILMYPVLVGLELPALFVLILGIWGVIKGVLMMVMGCGIRSTTGAGRGVAQPAISTTDARTAQPRANRATQAAAAIGTGRSAETGQQWNKKGSSTFRST